MQMPFETLGQTPVEDITGHQAAIHMLLSSLKAGAYLKDYKQFDTIRKMRTGFLNAWGALVKGMLLKKTGRKIDSLSALLILSGLGDSILAARSAWANMFALNWECQLR
jgi:hypothetical protein